MKILCPALLMLLGTPALAQTDHVGVQDLKSGNLVHENDFIYALPYPKGSAHLLVQAYMSKMSHKGEYALDFKMKKGSRVAADRSGIVVEIKEDSRRGGLKPRFLSQGNHVIIQHDDGTYGNYWHLKFKGALVKVGDTVQQGQVIGLSGNTGYTAFPHLHFEVTNTFSPGLHQLPTRFKTRKGVRYLKPLHWYKSI